MTKYKTISYHESHMRNNKFGSQISQLWSRLFFIFEDECRLLLKFEGCLTVHLPHEIMWNANLMQQGNFIAIFLARHVSGAYALHQEH